MKLLWLLFLVPLVEAKLEDDFSDVCPLNMKQWKHYFQFQHQQCIAAKRNESEKLESYLLKLETALNHTGEEIAREFDIVKSELNAISLDIKEFKGSSGLTMDDFDSRTNQLSTDISLIQDKQAQMEKKLEEFKFSILDSVRRAAIETVQNLSSTTNLKARNQEIERKCNIWKEKIGSSELIPLETGHYFYNTTKKLNWITAKEFCENRGLNLAVITTKRELELLENASPSKGSSSAYWVRASDSGRGPGNFFWSNGQPIDKSMWGTGQPDNFASGRETCVLLYPHGGKLYDNPCTYEWNLICKLDDELKDCL